MPSSNQFSRRSFISSSVAAITAGGAALRADTTNPTPAAQTPQGPKPGTADAATGGMPYGMIGKVKISRLMLGGNLVAGCMH